MLPGRVPGAPRRWWAALRERARDDTEFAQALVRFPVGITFVAATFFFAQPAAHPVYAQVYGQLPIAIAAYWLLAALLVLHIYRRPGHRDWRRQMALIADNFAIGVLLMTGAEAMLPAFAGLLWVTVGFGMRYGPRYLLLSIAAALVTCFVVTALNPWWRDHPAIPATLIFTILVTPTYAFFLHARLRSAQLATEAASLAKSRFLAQVSHDLRQPLHAMGLMSAGIVDAETPEVRRDLAARIDRSVHDARELLQTFLDRSIIETGRLKATPRPFSLGALLRELEQANRAAAAWDGTRLRFVFTSAWVDADRAFVRTMVQNLIANALRVSRGRSVLVGCRRQGKGLAVTVVDTGPGIDPAFMAMVADPATDPGHLADGRHAG
ncbi:MAG: sensor histidine kinase, partial [Sphingomonas sp.]